MPSSETTNTNKSLAIKIHNSIHDINNIKWNNLNGDSIFTSFEYLAALEDTNCVGKNTGWQIAHISLSDDTEIIGVIPLYIKYHSMGEYVFDHSWARAYEDAAQRNLLNGDYYPKLLSASPFTPVNGNRLLAKDADTKKLLAGALIKICNTNNISSAHINFPSDEDLETLKISGYLERIDTQFWWFNNNYNTFDDFLSEMTSSRRKVIKRERREVLSQIRFETYCGTDITEEHLNFLYSFIKDTYDRKWGKPYLTRSFFSQLLKTMPDKMVLFIAYQDETPIAGAINFIDNDTLYGRQWGCITDIPFLHFETCYYQAIEFAIKNNIKKVEAGTQGEHKISRGYRPCPVYFAHYISDNGFRNAIENYLAEESMAVKNIILELSENLPFKQK